MNLEDGDEIPSKLMDNIIWPMEIKIEVGMWSDVNVGCTIQEVYVLHCVSMVLILILVLD